MTLTGVSWIEILTFISLVVGLLAVIRDNGKRQGVQEEKNANMTSRIDKNESDIENLDRKLDNKLELIDVKVNQIVNSVGYIKGLLDRDE